MNKSDLIRYVTQELDLRAQMDKQETRTMGSSPRHTCASAMSTLFEMISNDLVR